MVYIINDTIFGENLKYIRERNGFSPFYMAKLLNITEERLHQLENGQYKEVDSLITRILQNLLGDECINLMEEKLSTIV